MEKYLIKFFVLLAALLCSASTVWSQDVIILKKNAEEIKALVQEVDLTEVKYKKYENAEGPSYTVLKTDIFMIKYANGEKDMFNDAVTPAPVTPTPTPPAPVNFSSSASTQGIYYYGLTGKMMKVFMDGENRDCMVVTAVEEGSPADEAGIKLFRIIVTIDGKPADNDLWQELKQKPEVTLTLKVWGHSGQQSDVLVKGLPVQANAVAHETDYVYHDLASKVIFAITERALEMEPVSIMADPEVDLFAYATFDFEFTDNNALQQKEIAAVIEKYIGMTRDRENPDILVFIEYYSDRSERYVPPSQELRTRYNTTYNFFTKRYETRQYVETETSRGYTETAYFTKLAISMADAKKMREGTANQSAIWQADYGVSSETKPDHKKFGKDIGFCMLAGFPFAPVRMNCFTYWFTGILYDASIPGKVAGVIPGSPADRAGIKAGNIIQKCSHEKNDIFKESFFTLLEKREKEKLFYFDYEGFGFTRGCKLRLRSSDSGIRNGTSSPFINTYMSSQRAVIRYGPKLEYVDRQVDYDRKPLVFTVKDINKKTWAITVRPEEKYHYSFNL
jgi:hypothetical protein